MHAAGERLFISAPQGMETALGGELAALGLQAVEVPGGFVATGPPGAHQDACLHLRSASYVLLRVGRFDARDVRSLEKGLEGVKLFAFTRGHPVLDVAVHRSSLKASAVRAAAGRIFGEAMHGQRVLIRIDGPEGEVSVDCAGELLYRRGYRQELSRAPMRETLAAGMLLLADYDGEQPLWDPMCGSGTILIEAALIAQRRAPGLARTFAFEQWPTFDKAGWTERRARAAAEVRQAPRLIVGSDLNAGSLGVARRNARRAGLLEALMLERKDATEISPPAGRGPGLIVSNLPYGRRVGGGDLVALHRAFGDAVRRFSGWRAALLTGSPRLADALELHGRRLDVDNGGLHCVLVLAEIL